YPSAQQFVAGVYYGHTLLGKDRNSALGILQTEGRFGVRGSADQELQLELEWALMATLGRWLDLGAQARVSIGGSDWSLPALESARADVSVRPGKTLRILAAFRYLDPKTDFDTFAEGLLATRRAYHASLDVAWDPKPWLSLSLLSG